MQEHLKRLEGVSKVDVSLETGKVVIYAKGDGKLNPSLIMKATYDSGVSVSEMTITATGQLIKNAAKGMQFKGTGDQIFDIVPLPVSESVKELADSNATLRVRGRLYKRQSRKEKGAPRGPLLLEILEVIKKG